MKNIYIVCKYPETNHSYIIDTKKDFHIVNEKFAESLVENFKNQDMENHMKCTYQIVKVN